MLTIRDIVIPLVGTKIHVQSSVGTLYEGFIEDLTGNVLDRYISCFFQCRGEVYIQLVAD